MLQNCCIFYCAVRLTLAFGELLSGAVMLEGAAANRSHRFARCTCASPFSQSPCHRLCRAATSPQHFEQMLALLLYPVLVPTVQFCLWKCVAPIHAQLPSTRSYQLSLLVCTAYWFAGLPSGRFLYTPLQYIGADVKLYSWQ